MTATAVAPIVVEHRGEDALLTAIVGLGYYTIRPDKDTGRRRRTKTSIGDLLHTGKYAWWLRENQREEALAALSGHLIACAQTHELLAGVSAVAAVPGTTSHFSEDLAAEISTGLNLPLIGVRSRVRGGHTAKSHHVKKIIEIPDDGDRSCAVVGRRVLVVDDFISTGSSMCSTAQAVMHAGADACCGLVAVVPST